MAQLPGPQGTWIPVPGAEQFLDVGASTALTLPTQAQVASVFAGGSSKAGIETVAILTAQGQQQWIRSDGTAVTAAASGGLMLDVGNYMIVEGRSALSNIRVIRAVAGGSLNVRYYVYRAAPGARF